MANRTETLPDQPSSAATVLATKIDPTSAKFEANMRFMADLMSQVRNEGEKICEGGGAKAIENQHGKKRLTARERMVFELRHYEGHRLKRIGEILGTSEEAAKNCLFRATQKMRAALGDFV